MNLKNLIQKKETTTLELKPSLSQIDDIVETVSAFSNTKGGTVVIGVTDNGKIKGVEIGKDTLERLSNKIMQNTDPRIHPEVLVEEINKKKIILGKVKESTDKLVLAFGRPYKRVGSSTTKMSKEEYERLILEKHKDKLQFDKQPCEEATLKDIDNKKIKWYLEQREKARNISKKIKIPIGELLQNIKALKGNKPTHAAILFLSKYPQRFIPNARSLSMSSSSLCFYT